MRVWTLAPALLMLVSQNGCEGCGSTRGHNGYDAADIGEIDGDPFHLDAVDGELPDVPIDQPGEEVSCPTSVVCGSPPVCCDVGEECIEGECLPACPSGVRCGEDLATCCAGGEVCIDAACVTPGEECIDSYDCGLGMFCEPTLGRCLPQFDPVTCEVRVEPEPFEVTLEWSWPGDDIILPEYDQPISAPVVVDLDGDRIPEVVFSATLRGEWRDAVLRAIRGDTGEDVWVVQNELYRLNGRASIAAGDIDGDGNVEILAFSRGDPVADMNSILLCFNWDGTLRWMSRSATADPSRYVVNNACPTIADLDGDGDSEIVVGGLLFDHTGLELFNNGVGQGTNASYTGGLPAVADIDMDGTPEIVTGSRAWEADGSLLWDSTADHGTLDGFPAVADFDLDGTPEVAIVASGTVEILEGESGAPYWTAVAIPGGGIGGPPTVSDFDGDTFPEIGVAGADSYSIYDPNGSSPVLWSHATQDHSSNTTGSSVFDFEADGVSEVIYCDECFMRVYAGQTGDILLAVMNSSLTIHEYPLVADADGDGNSEIVVVANDWWFATNPDYCDASAAIEGVDTYVGRHGVYLYGDAHDRWVPTRRIWNEHTYHVTNVNADGSIPAHEENNWQLEGLNNFRQNVQGEGVYNAPDLAIIALSVDLSGCPGTATLQARVANIGNLGVPAGVEVAFYEGTPSAPLGFLGTASTTVPLLPGASTLVTIEVPLEGSPPFAFFAVVDDDGTGVGVIVECDEDNNREAIDGVDCAIVI
jgi:hypothetical protein